MFILRPDILSLNGIVMITHTQVPKMSFGEEPTRTDGPNFPPQRFLTKAVLTAREQNDGLD